MLSTGRPTQQPIDKTQEGANVEMKQDGEANEGNLATGEADSQAIVSELSFLSTRTY